MSLTLNYLQSMSSSFPLFAFLVSLVLILVTYRKRSKPKGQPTHRPLPGPPKLPIIGNLHQLAGSSCAHITLRDLAKIYGPIMRVYIGEPSTIVISSPEIAREVLKTHEIAFAQRPLYYFADFISYDNSSMVLSPYGDHWRQIRKVCVTEVLSAKRVHSFRSMREDQVHKFIQSISNSKQLGHHSINLSEKIYTLINNIISMAAFGTRCKYQDEFISALKEQVGLCGYLVLPDLFPSLKFLGVLSGTKYRLQKVHKKIDRILEAIIYDRTKERNCNINGCCNDKLGDESDLIGVLLKLQNPSNEFQFTLTTNNVKAAILDILSAGTDTTAASIVWTMSALIKHPRVMAKAQAEVRRVFAGKTRITEEDLEKLDYLKSTIKESLRLYSPVPIIPRETRERCKIKGYEFEPKARVLINSWALGRDPDYWVEPDTFLPERFMNGCSDTDFHRHNCEYLPFGAGRRMCPGLGFALISKELIVSQLLYYFDWVLPNGENPEELDMTGSLGLTLRRKHDLCVIPTPCFT